MAGGGSKRLVTHRGRQIDVAGNDDEAAHESVDAPGLPAQRRQDADGASRLGNDDMIVAAPLDLIEQFETRGLEGIRVDRLDMAHVTRFSRAISVHRHCTRRPIVARVFCHRHDPPRERDRRALSQR